MSVSRACTLVPRQEVRFSAAAEDPVTITLVNGMAECFGSQLVPLRQYVFHQVSSAIFSFNGCELFISTSEKGFDAVYFSAQAHEPPMVQYCGIDAILSCGVRFKAKSQNQPGPVVLITGTPDSGTTTFCRILCNYAANNSWSPLLADIDLNSPGNIPGTISLSVVAQSSAIESSELYKNAMCYFLGTSQASEKTNKLYLKICSKLAAHCKSLLEKRKNGSGAIIHAGNTTPDSIDYQALLENIQRFEANYIIVVGNEQLANGLKTDIRNLPFVSPPEVVVVQKSGGVVQKTPLSRKVIRQQSFINYFYNRTQGDRSPCFRQCRKYSEIECIRMVEACQAPASALPLGKTSLLNPERAVSVDLSAEDVLHLIVGMVFNSKESDGTCPIVGIAHIVENNTLQQQLTFLTCCEYLPADTRVTLLFGNLRWIDSQ